MHELFNTHTGKIISIPSDIEELTPEQYLFYIELALDYLNGTINSVQEVKRRLFVKLADVKVSWKMPFYTKETQEAIWNSLENQINLMDSFFDIEETETGHKYTMHTNCAVNLLPEWNGYKTYTNIFSEMNWGDFRKCSELLKLIHLEVNRNNDREADELTKELFFTLYRKKRKEKRTLKVPDSILFHALNYFSHILELITTVPIEINGEEIDFFTLWEKDEDDDIVPNKIGWNNIHFEISEKGVFGNAEQADKEKFINIFLWMYKQHADAIAMEKRLNKNINNG